MKIKFWGTRGSIPVPGKNTIKFGGNTACVQISDGDKFIILDAGTGIRELGNELMQNHLSNEIHLLISHTHWDHIQGLPFFSPIYNDQCTLDIYAEIKHGASIDRIFETQWDPNYFPVTSEIFKDKVKYIEIGNMQNIDVNGFNVSSINTHHSEGTLAYKIEKNGKKIVYMTDNELYYDAKRNLPTGDEILEKNRLQVEFIKDADVLIHDTMYQHEDYGEKIGWGHSNNYSASVFANLGNVKKLLLFHYDPDYTDRKIEAIELETNELLKELNSSVICEGAFDAMELII